MRANSAAARLFSRSGHRLIGCNIAALFASSLHADSFRRMLAASCKMRHRKASRGRDVALRLNSGKLATVTCWPVSRARSRGLMVVLVRVSAGRPVVVQGASTTATNGLLPLVAEFAEDCVIITDANGLTLWANVAAQKMSGYRLDEMIGLKPGAFMQGPETDPQTIAQVSRAIAAGKPVHCEILNYHRSGHSYWLDMAISPIADANGKIDRFISISREVTEKKSREILLADAPRKIELAEGRLATAIETISEGFVIYDSQDRLVMANSAYREMRAVDADLLVPGTTFEEIVRASVVRGHYDTAGEDPETWITQQLEARKKGGDVETLVQFADGRWMLRRERRTAQGEMIGIRSDVTAFKQHEAELKMARREADRASRAKSDFVANISHELRTPINGIMGFNQLMLKDELSPAQRTRAECIRTASEDLLRLVNDLLDLSKITSGSVDLRIAPFNLNDFLVETVQAMTPLAEEKGIELVLRARLSPDLNVEGDRARIKQIFLNLLGNSVKFTDEGQVSIAADLYDGGVRFEIADTGPGIPADRLENVFDRFVQVGASPNQRDGAGLGLSITRKLVDLMGGKIEVSSEFGRGSLFCVMLPLPIVGAACEPSGKLAGNDHQQPDAVMLDVLVAEDHPINQRLINEILDAIGCRVSIVDNGAAALARLEAEDFDLMIVDHQMPVMTGLDAIRRIRARSDWKMRIPIIALTANAMRGSEVDYARLGVDEFMTKPLMLDRVIEAVRRLGLVGRALRIDHPPQAGE